MASTSIALLFMSLSMHSAATSSMAGSPGKSKKSFCSSPAFALEWSDEFDGRVLNASHWSVVEGTSPHPFDSVCSGDECPIYSGCREGFCLPRNVYVRDGAVHLRSDNSGHENYTFTTAAIVSRGHVNWTWADKGPYRLCVNATLPGTPGANNAGLWPALWMLPDVANRCDPDGGEIDLIEMVDGNATNVPIDYWFQRAWPARSCAAPPGPNASNLIHVLPPLADWASWHEFAIEAGPTWLAAALDGAVVLNWTSAETGAIFYDERYYLLMNLALGGGWPSDPTNATRWPAIFKIDYVRVARAVA